MRLFHLDMKENRDAAKCSRLVEKQKDFANKNLMIRSLKKV